MQTRSQTYANRDAAQRHVEDYLANVKANVKAKKAATTVTETPQKQPQLQEVNAPTKKPRTENHSDTPKSTGHRTRLSTGAIERKNLTVEFDEAFFNDASNAWNENKIKIGNGMYMYITRSVSKKQ